MQFSLALLALLPAALAVPAADTKYTVPACGCRTPSGSYVTSSLCLLRRGTTIENGKFCYTLDDQSERADKVFTADNCNRQSAGSKPECKNITVCKNPLIYVPC
ncbi:uncharacterized protein B0J16DRAFT_389125 [Fusarium flagelliforme]|uniref:Uncharacterized protein n=1 Tax=Fusarium flagelliforme TaxID=2675880 RepID=A0A395N1G4_9HYPO|nr:uncharacterized protein B0J16DRAFT_389125 [Fusarium flagelliforme]KAH7173241.1 hypothetical protein B0J16DRAFT_389125 [Fusarium flagelliforme]RFN53968.1 hypothetical protein FIE12Z_1715 [Fusarium flagelliforme]